MYMEAHVQDKPNTEIITFYIFYTKVFVACGEHILFSFEDVNERAGNIAAYKCEDKC